jgi:hypothetical protein
MTLKIIIIVLLFIMLASLISGFNFLVKDKGATNRKRTFYALAIRITSAILLLLTISYGLWSGQLHIHAPWM